MVSRWAKQLVRAALTWNGCRFTRQASVFTHGYTHGLFCRNFGLFSPQARWWSLVFIGVTSVLPPSSFFLNCELQISVGTAGPQLASSRSQWALLDLNCELQISVGRISVGTAGPQPRAPDSTASSRSQWALPGLNCELQISVGTAIVPVPCCACWLTFHITFLDTCFGALFYFAIFIFTP